MKFKELLDKELEKKVIVNGKKISTEEALMMRLLSSAFKGKAWAYKMILDRRFGKTIRACPRCGFGKK